MQEGGSPAEPNSTILSAFSGLEGHRSNLRSTRPSVTTGSFCFLSIFLPGTWLLLNSERRQAVCISCEIPRATKVCWDRGPGGKAPGFSFVYVQESSIAERHLSWCWSSSSTKNKIANKFAMDKLAHAERPLHLRSGTFRRQVLQAAGDIKGTEPMQPLFSILMGVEEADQITDALNNVMNGTFNRLLKTFHGARASPCLLLLYISSQRCCTHWNVRRIFMLVRVQHQAIAEH